jgi:hypothetical protein
MGSDNLLPRFLILAKNRSLAKSHDRGSNAPARDSQIISGHEANLLVCPTAGFTIGSLTHLSAP